MAGPKGADITPLLELSNGCVSSKST